MGEYSSQDVGVSLAHVGRLSAACIKKLKQVAAVGLGGAQASVCDSKPKQQL